MKYPHLYVERDGDSAVRVTWAPHPAVMDGLSIPTDRLPELVNKLRFLLIQDKDSKETAVHRLACIALYLEGVSRDFRRDDFDGDLTGIRDAIAGLADDLREVADIVKGCLVRQTFPVPGEGVES
jgi:hypothetical protein